MKTRLTYTTNKKKRRGKNRLTSRFVTIRKSAKGIPPRFTYSTLYIQYRLKITVILTTEVWLCCIWGIRGELSKVGKDNVTDALWCGQVRTSNFNYNHISFCYYVVSHHFVYLNKFRQIMGLQSVLLPQLSAFLVI